MSKVALASDICLQLFGPVVQSVMLVLMERGRSTLSELINACASHPQTQVTLAPSLAVPRSPHAPPLERVVKDNLIIGIQHAFVLVEEEETVLRGSGPAQGGSSPEPRVKTTAYYTALPDELIRRLRIPRVLQIAYQVAGEFGEAIAQELLANGRHTPKRLIEAAEASLNTFDQRTAITRAFRLLANQEFIVPASSWQQNILQIGQPRTEEDDDDDSKLTSATTAKKTATKAKRTAKKAQAKATPPAPARRDAMEIDALEGMEGAGQNSSAAVDHLAESEDDLWFINYTRFMAYQRQIKCIELISEKIDTNAGFIVRCLFDLVEPQLRIRSTDEQRLQQIANISIPEEKLWEYIQNAQLSEEGPNITQTSLSSYLSLMTRDSARFLARTKLPPGVVINIRSMIDLIKQKCIESIVHDKFGPEALRIFRLLKIKKMLEQKQISDMAMIPLKTTRDCLYKMLARNIVHLQEVPRSADRAPGKMFYLWTVNTREVSQVFVDEIYQVMHKIRQRIQKIYDDHEALFNRLAEEERLNQEQLANLPIITDLERAQAHQQQAIIDQLQAAILRLDETLMILTEF